MPIPPNFNIKLTKIKELSSRRLLIRKPEKHNPKKHRLQTYGYGLFAKLSNNEKKLLKLLKLNNKEGILFIENILKDYLNIQDKFCDSFSKKIKVNNTFYLLPYYRFNPNLYQDTSKIREIDE
ncbi:MAG: hypothetical protein ABEI32_09040 [Halothece sp.]